MHSPPHCLQTPFRRGKCRPKKQTFTIFPTHLPQTAQRFPRISDRPKAPSPVSPVPTDRPKAPSPVSPVPTNLPWRGNNCVSKTYLFLSALFAPIKISNRLNFNLLWFIKWKFGAGQGTNGAGQGTNGASQGKFGAGQGTDATGQGTLATNPYRQ